MPLGASDQFALPPRTAVLGPPQAPEYDTVKQQSAKHHRGQARRRHFAVLVIIIGRLEPRQPVFVVEPQPRIVLPSILLARHQTISSSASTPIRCSPFRITRSEERRVGTECDSPCRSRWSPSN